MITRICPALIALLFGVLGADPALAHRMKVFATAEGATVSGHAYFAGGAKARDVAVTVTGPNGMVVFEGATDEVGRFSFQATRRMDHRIVVDGADGHRSEYRLPADELPETLPAMPSDKESSPEPATLAPAPASPDFAETQAMIERGVARQIQPLREQLDAFQEEIRWNDVLGGIGYIVGLGGLAYGVTARRGRGAS